MHIYTAEFDQHHHCMQVLLFNVISINRLKLPLSPQHCQKIGGGRGPPVVTQQQLDVVHKEVIGLD